MIESLRFTPRFVQEPTPEEPRSDFYVGNLISAAGNHELKALLLARMALHPERSFSDAELTNDIREAQREEKDYSPVSLWNINGSTRVLLFRFCYQSLEPIGLVAKEVRLEDNIIGYKATTRGTTDGLALIGLLIESSQKRGIPLSEVFGGTSSRSPKDDSDNNPDATKRRSPHTRIAIFREMLKHGNQVKFIDLVKRLGGEPAKSLIARHLSALEESGVITIKKGAKVRGVFESLVSLGPSQRDFIAELVSIIDQFKNGDKEIIEHGKKVAIEYATNPEKVVQLLNTARKGSHRIGRVPSRELKENIVRILDLNPNATSAIVRATLERELEINIGKPRVRWLMRDLEKAKRIHQSEFSGKEYIWNAGPKNKDLKPAV